MGMETDQRVHILRWASKEGGQEKGMWSKYQIITIDLVVAFRFIRLTIGSPDCQQKNWKSVYHLVTRVPDSPDCTGTMIQWHNGNHYQDTLNLRKNIVLQSLVYSGCRIQILLKCKFDQLIQTYMTSVISLHLTPLWQGKSILIRKALVSLVAGHKSP